MSELTIGAELEATLIEVARREGTPEEWGNGFLKFAAHEAVWDIVGRLQRYLLETTGESHRDNMKLREIAGDECDRQRELIQEWKYQQELAAHEQKYRKHIEPTVTSLADALERFVATRDKPQLIEDLYSALRPGYKNQQEESARVQSFFRPIG